MAEEWEAITKVVRDAQIHHKFFAAAQYPVQLWTDTAKIQAALEEVAREVRSAVLEEAETALEEHLRAKAWCLKAARAAIRSLKSESVATKEKP